MPRPPHLAHSPAPEKRFEPVAPELPGRRHLAAEPVDHPRAEVREHHRERRVHGGPDVIGGNRLDPPGPLERQERQGDGRPRGQGSGEHPPGRTRQHQREQNHDRRHPGEIRNHPELEVVLPERDGRDDRADHDLVQEPHREERRRTRAALSRRPPEEGGRAHRRKVHPLERGRVAPAGRSRRALEQRHQRLGEIEDDVERERREHERGEEPHPPADLLLEVRWERRGALAQVRSPRLAPQLGDVLRHAGS